VLNYRKPKVVIIGGPTATGKTSFAISLAKELDGEIVNADSMQVYREMDIGTAKPSKVQRATIPHHMLDVVYPDEPFNAALYRSMALPAITDIWERGKIPIVVGGTGLYIKTLRGGLLLCPEADPDLRARIREEYESLGPEHMYERLQQLDPEAAKKIHLNDRIRVMRAIEIYELTKRRPSELAKNHGFREKPFDDIVFCLYLDREVLYERINKRSEKMIEEGLVEETKRLLDKGYSPQLKSMQAIGYRHMVRFLTNNSSLGAALRELQRDTRRYAKRQITWFRAEPEFIWVRPHQYEAVVKRVRSFLAK